MATETKNTLRKVMTMAWQFVRKNGYTMSEALKCAWLNIKNKANMTKGIAHFYFRKIDGTIREAWGTIKTTLVPETKGANRKENPTIQTYYDTEKEEWRCYKVANLVMIA